MADTNTFFAHFDDKNPQSVKYDCWDISGSEGKILGILHQSSGWAEQRIAQAPPSTIQGLEFQTKGMLRHLEPFLVENWHEPSRVSKLVETKLLKESKDTSPLTPLNVYVQTLVQKAISGDSDKPYCKHCECEFANTGNLHKHYKNAVACNKLAHKEFRELMAAKID
jgi:hypothetical protein